LTGRKIGRQRWGGRRAAPNYFRRETFIPAVQGPALQLPSIRWVFCAPRWNWATSSANPRQGKPLCAGPRGSINGGPLRYSRNTQISENVCARPSSRLEDGFTTSPNHNAVFLRCVPLPQHEPPRIPGRPAWKPQPRPGNRRVRKGPSAGARNPAQNVFKLSMKAILS